MRRTTLIIALLAGMLSLAATAAETLKKPSDFAKIADKTERNAKTEEITVIVAERAPT